MTVQVNTYKAISSLKLVRAEHITNTDTRASRAKVSNRGNFIIGVHDFPTSRAFHYEGVAGASVNRAVLSSTCHSKSRGRCLTPYSFTAGLDTLKRV